MRNLKWLLALFSLQSLLAVLWIFFSPSQSGRAVVLWLSPARLLLLAAGLAIWLVILAGTLLVWRRSGALESIQSGIDHLCLELQRLAPLLVFLVVIPLLLLFAALAVVFTPLEYDAYRSWGPDSFPLLHSFVDAILPILLLVVLLALETAVYLVAHYRRDLHAPGLWSWGNLASSLVMLVIGVLTVFYWLVLAFQLRFFANNPAWYWKLEPVPFHVSDLIFVLIALLLLALAYWALIRHHRLLAGLIVLFLLGWFLQIGVGLMAGDGFDAFRQRYFSTYHKTYISKAAQGSISLAQGIQDYETLYGSRAFTNTKPPGLMTFYLGLDHLINGYPSPYPDEARYERLSDVVAFAFPILAMLLIFAVCAFTLRFIQRGAGLAAALAPALLVLCPNLVLFSLFPDQALYPLLFLLGMSLVVIVIRRGSLILAFLLGLFLYLLTFFAFTMLPLYPFAGIFLLLDHWVGNRLRPWKSLLWMGLAIAAGTLLLHILFRLFLNYDFLPRFEKTILINHNFDFYERVGRPLPSAPESLWTRLQQIAGAAWLNNLDFAAAVGFPVYVLFVLGAVALVRRLVTRAASAADVVLGSALLSFLLLNLAGTAQGEVPRLWLFWLPMIVLLAALELEPFVAKRPHSFLWLALAQLVTLFLTFHFQDLRM